MLTDAERTAIGRDIYEQIAWTSPSRLPSPEVYLMRMRGLTLRGAKPELDPNPIVQDALLLAQADLSDACGVEFATWRTYPVAERSRRLEDVLGDH